MINAILFDVDGVLLDSMLANAEWFREMLEHFGYRGPRDDEMYALFHLPGADVVRKYAADASEEKIKEILHYGYTKESRLVDHLLRVPDHAVSTVQKLARHYQLGIVTSRRNVYMAEVYAYFPRKLFQAVVTIEDTKKRKPDPEPLLLAAERLGVPADHCVYVGDMPSDVEAGRAAGMKVIIFSKNEIPGADAQTENFAEIPVMLEKLF